MTIRKIGVFAAALAFTSMSAHARDMTPQERAQMQKEIAWQKQQQIKADQDRRSSYTEKCYMVAGTMKCAANRAPDPTPSRNAVVPSTGKVGTAYRPTTNQGSGYSYQQTVPSSKSGSSSNGGYFGRSYKGTMN